MKMTRRTPRCSDAGEPAGRRQQLPAARAGRAARRQLPQLRSWRRPPRSGQLERVGKKWTLFEGKYEKFFFFKMISFLNKFLFQSRSMRARNEREKKGF